MNSKLIKKTMLMLCMVIAWAPMSYANDKQYWASIWKPIVVGFASALGAGLGYGITWLTKKLITDKEFRAEFIKMVKKVDRKKFAKNVLSKNSTFLMKGLMKLTEEDLEKLPIEQTAQIARDLGVQIPGINSDELERISRGDAIELTDEKLRLMKQKMADAIQTQFGSEIDAIKDVAQRKATLLSQKVAEEIAAKTGLDVNKVKDIINTASESEQELLKTVKKIGKNVREKGIKRLGREQYSKLIRSAPSAAFQKLIPVDIEIDGDDIEAIMSENSFKDALDITKFYDNYRAIYKQKGASGFKEILKDYKNKWLEENPHIPKKQTARKFLEDMSKIMTKEAADIHNELGAKLDNMSADKLMKKSSVMDALESGMVPIFEPRVE